MAEEAAEPLGVLVMPSLPYGLTPYFAAYPGSPTLRVETYGALLVDLLDSLADQGFRRFLFVNGHGGNEGGRPAAEEWATAHPDCRVLWHDWWAGKQARAVVDQIDGDASHASWFENFPWTRLEGVALPDERKPMADIAQMRTRPEGGARAARRRLARRALRAAGRRRAARLGGGRAGGARPARARLRWLTCRSVAIVTGTAHGIGAAIATALAASGAEVHGCDRDTVDVSDAGEVADFVAGIGRVDILVNNAGGVVGQVGRPLDEVSDDDWRAVVDANLTSTFVCTRAVAPGMKERRYGRIVNISSGAGRSVSLTGIQAYASAKAGQLGFTRQTAHELGPFGITVNAIAPGFVLSNPTSIAQYESYGEEGQRRLVESIACAGSACRRTSRTACSSSLPTRRRG